VFDRTNNVLVEYGGCGPDACNVDSSLTGFFLYRYKASDAQVPSDATPPTLAIINPASSTFSTSAATIDVSGTASDDISVTVVTWVCNGCAVTSGTANGTTNWMISAIPLNIGTNIIAVTAHDAATNTTTRSLTVTRTSAGDTQAPVIQITTPTSNPTYATSDSNLDIAGSCIDNIACTSVTWSNDRGGSGSAAGLASWSVSGIALQSGDNVLTVTARDAANNSGTDVLTVTYTPGGLPNPVTIKLSAGQIKIGAGTTVKLGERQ
jgi:hypothetical protein